MSSFVRVPLLEKEFTHDKFAGLRNNVANSRFELDDLEAALNIDLDDTGRASRRSGFNTQILAGNCHSVGPNNAGRCFVVAGTNLYEIFPDLTTTIVVSGITPNLPVSYVVVGDLYYWSNGIDQGCVDSTGARSMGLAIPPQIAGTVGSGTLMLGKEDLTTARYQFAMTYLRNDDQESGAGMANYLDVPNEGGIVFDNLPVSADPTVNRKAIYISEANGEKMYRAIVMRNAATSVIYRGRGRMTLPLATQFLGAPPLGSIMSFQGGSLLVAVGNKLHYSEAFAPELFDRRKYYPFSSKITILFSIEEGTHVGTEDGHYWMGGQSPDKYGSDLRATYGAIPGTLDICPSSLFGKEKTEDYVGLWASKEGIVMATQDGQVINMTRDRFLYPVQEFGSGVMRKMNGVNQFIAVLKGAETPAASYQP